ncbi:hypothetical protein DKE47_022015 (plasmid) [Acinetobacter nosocomialis]|nr:hypothetical protein DKE47_022015 [Acinetobacter nosocomialis]
MRFIEHETRPSVALAQNISKIQVSNLSFTDALSVCLTKRKKAGRQTCFFFRLMKILHLLNCCQMTDFQNKILRQNVANM